MRKLFLIIISILPLFPLKSEAKDIVISTDNKAQVFEGWGVSLCWWAHMCGSWSEEHIDEIIDWLVSPEGLNYNLFRYNIGGGDDPQNRNCELHHMAKGKGIRAEIPGYKAYPDSPYNWQADSAQVKIMLKIKQRRPDAIFEAFSNSAPWWMTVSGCCAGHADAKKDNLRTDCHKAFAQYLVDVCRHIKETYGIEFRTLEPFNEALSSYWSQNGSQEGCHFDVQTQKDVIKAVYEELRHSGLNTVISASDETSVEHSLKAFKGYGDALKMVGQWNTHTYSATDEHRRELRQMAAEHGIRLWQSESGSGGKGIDGNLRLMQRMFDDMNIMQPAAWCDWQYIEERGDQWCLVSGNFETEEYHKVRPYYIRQHASRFILPGYTILSTDDRETLAALSPDSKTLVIVMLNNTDQTRQKTYILPKGYKARREYTTSEDVNMAEQPAKGRKRLSVDMCKRSIKTIILER